MYEEEVKILYDKKEKEGKPEKQILKEINDVKESQIILKNNKKEIKQLKKKIEQLEKENNKLKNLNLKLGLKTKPTIITEYYDKPFPKKNEVNRVRLVLISEKKPMTINEIKKIAYGLTLGKIRDCLMILYFQGLIEKKGDKFEYKLKC